jgi:hypothetical protein
MAQVSVSRCALATTMVAARRRGSRAPPTIEQARLHVGQASRGGGSSMGGIPMATTAPAQLRAPAPRSAIGQRAAGLLAHTDALGPGIVVTLVLAGLIGGGLAAHSGDPLAFVRFGRDFVSLIHPPPGALIYAHAGYDGQYFWTLAQDPLLLHARTLVPFVTQSFRLQRIAYPALAWILAGGRASATAWTLIAVNGLVVIGATLGFAAYARLRGWSGWWGLALGLLPGFAYAVLGDLSDALATTAMIAGLIAWGHGRPGTAGLAFAVACLAREPMVLAVVAVALAGLLDARRRGDGWSRISRQLLGRPVLVPALAFAAWQVYVHVRLGVSTTAPWTAFAAPFSQFGVEFGHALANRSPVGGAWDGLYLAAMVAGIALALVHAWRHPDAPALAAGLFALLLPILTFGYAWSYTRLSAPLFACLLLVGLQRRSRPTCALSILVACLGVVVPLSIG